MKTIIFTLVIFYILGCMPEKNSTQNSDTNTNINISQNDIDNSLKRHNEIRNELYSGYDLIWNDEVASSAQEYANILAKSGEFKHNNPPYGENLFASSYKTDFVEAINSWYSEKKDYNYNSNSCNSGKVCGHYTQLVWKNSEEVGCGIAVYEKGNFKNGVVIVCRYNPAGNYIGEKPY